MGVRIFSKIKAKTWPHCPTVAAKCKKAYDDWLKMADISVYEHKVMNASESQQFITVPSKPNTALPGARKRNFGGSQLSMTSQPRQEQAKPIDKRTFNVRGRHITVGECEFVFKRVWNVTCDH